MEAVVSEAILWSSNRWARVEGGVRSDNLSIILCVFFSCFVCLCDKSVKVVHTALISIALGRTHSVLSKYLRNNVGA